MKNNLEVFFKVEDTEVPKMLSEEDVKQKDELYKIFEEINNILYDIEGKMVNL